MAAVSVASAATIAAQKKLSNGSTGKLILPIVCNSFFSAMIQYQLDPIDVSKEKK
jgi:hypothetical protein